MTPLENLTVARSLIEKPENWTQHAFARDAHGGRINVNSPNAKCFCLAGALQRAYYKPGLVPNTGGSRLCSGAIPLTDSARAIGSCNGSFVDYNDDPKTTHADVLWLLDATIERLNTGSGKAL